MISWNFQPPKNGEDEHIRLFFIMYEYMVSTGWLFFHSLEKTKTNCHLLMLYDFVDS